MKKLMTILFTSLFLASTAYAGGMIGVKVGTGELEGTRTSTSEASGVTSAAKNSEYGAIFAEVNLADSPVSLGIELVPMEGIIDTKDDTATDTQVTVSDLITLYLLASKEMEFGSIYGKIGYATADLSAVSNYGHALTNMSKEADGPMLGVGAQFDVTADMISTVINTVRLEATHSMFDDLKITSAGQPRTGDAELTTFSISLGKSF